MGNIKVALQAKTINTLNSTLVDFEKSRNLGGILRIIAIKAFSVGDSYEKIADTINTSVETIRNWVNDFLARGTQSFYPAKSTGRPKKLSDSEMKLLKLLLEKSPEDLGFRGGCWDSKKIRKLILDQFGKKLSKKYIPEILKQLGLSYKKARVDFGNPSEVLRERWINFIWPKILDTAEKQDAHIFFGDEAYFSIFGTPGYTWSMTGSDNVIRSTGSKESLHLIGAINYNTGNIHALMTEDMVDEDIFICYLQTLLKETRKHCHLIVDNATYHKSEKVIGFLTDNSSRLTIHYLPPYSPDYNPIEGLWKKIKKETTHNVYFESLEALGSALAKGLKWFRQEPSEVKSLFGFYEKLA
jgi:transposase